MPVTREKVTLEREPITDANVGDRAVAGDRGGAQERIDADGVDERRGDRR